MYRKIALKLTNALVNSRTIDLDEHEIYAYSIEILISDFVYFLIATVIAVYTKTELETCLFYCGFLSVRKYAGGYHANSYLMCHILFMLNQLLMIFLLFIVPNSVSYFFSIFFTLISLVCVFLFAPISNTNRPYTDRERKRFKKLSRTVSMLTVVIVITLGLFRISPKYLLVYSFGVFSVSVSLFAEKIKEQKKEEKAS